MDFDSSTRTLHYYIALATRMEVNVTTQLPRAEVGMCTIKFI